MMGLSTLRRVTLIALLPALVACNSTSAEELVQRAQISYDAGQYRTAMIEAKNAVQQQPDLAQARLLLGQIHMKLGDYPSALKEFERALDLGLSGTELSVGLLTAKNRTGRYQEVIGELEGTGALAPELAVVLGDAYLAGQDNERAQAMYLQAVDLPGANMGLGMVAWGQGDQERARNYLSNAVELDSGNAEAWFRLGEFELAQRNWAAAQAAFEKLRETPAGEVSGTAGLAKAALGQGDEATAAEHVAALLEAAPQLPMAHYLDGLVKYQQQDIDGAETALREVQRYTPNHLPTIYLMGAVHFHQGQLGQAQDNLSRYLAADSTNESAAKLLASVYQQQGSLESVVETLLPFRESSADPQLLAMLGTAQMQLGDAAAASETLQAAVELAPDGAAFRNQLALSLLYSGDAEAAKGELESAIEVDGQQFQSDYLLAMMHVKEGNLDAAAASVDELIRKSPDSPVGYSLKGMVLFAQQNVDGAEAEYEKALEIDPTYLPAVKSLAGIDTLAGDVDKAKARFERLLEVVPDSEDAWLSLADLAMQQGNLEEAEGYVRSLVEKGPPSLRAHVGLTRLYLQQNRSREARREIEAALELAPEAPEVLLLGANVALATSNLREARDRANALQTIANARENARLFVALGALQLRVGELTLARSNLERVLRDDADNVNALLELGRLDLLEGRTRGAREKLTRLQQLEAQGAPVALLEGDTRHAEGDSEGAIALFRQLAEAGDREGVKRLVLAELSRADAQAAIAAADQWLAAHPEDVGVRLLRADALMRVADKSAAIAEYERLVEAENPLALNNLAWLYMERSDARALSTAQKAHELAPDSADIADTLGWILVREGRAEEAIPYLRRSVQLNPRNPTVQYHLGIAYRDTGDRFAAKTAFDAASALGEFPEREETLQALEELAGT